MKPRYLTKSRFKIAYQCPAKLYYHDHPESYANKNRENKFLEALAKGGFQVGAMAKLYYPDGIDLQELSPEEAIEKTRSLLERESVTLFEAALQNGPFLVLVDILVKKGNEISLIEVKSTSHDFEDPDRGFFKKKDRGIKGDWEPYLIDVAFQTWVANQA